MNISRGQDGDRIPSNWRHVAESATLWSRAWRQVGHLGPRGPRNGIPTLVIPGFVANDRTTLELRRALAEHGYRVHGWGHGWNLGATADVIDRLKRRADEVSEQPLLLIGWSLGGLFARELARAHPERVRAVVTLASPFSGDPKLNNIWKLYEWVAKHPVDQPPIERITDKPPVPTLALWGRRDGILAQSAARGHAHESDRSVGLDFNHMEFACSRRATRKVVQEIGRFLAEHSAGSDSNPTTS